LFDKIKVRKAKEMVSMAKELDFNGITFDDFVVDKEGGVWSQVCDKCANKYEIDAEKYLDTIGSGICGVKGCNNDGDSYIDWTVNDVTIEEVD
jgi:hypothetical protein